MVKMEYLTVYRPYEADELLGKAKSKKEGGYHDEAEAKDWNSSLNKWANKGYRVIKCGLVVIDKCPTFWATLEKPQDTK